MARGRNRNSFKMGTVDMVVLHLLSQRDLYGYEITLLTKELSGGRYFIAETAIYPVLYRMVDEGYISDRGVRVGSRKRRIYYHLEEKGRERLQELTEDYRTTAVGIEMILSGEIPDSIGTNIKGETEP